MNTTTRSTGTKSLCDVLAISVIGTIAAIVIEISRAGICRSRTHIVILSVYKMHSLQQDNYQKEKA